MIMKEACWCYVSRRRVRLGLSIVCAVMASTPLAGIAAPGDDAARASLARVQARRAEHPADGVLIYYEALLRINLGERDAALALLRSLKGRKLGLVPVRDFGFAAVWDDPRFQALREELATEEPRTPAAPVAFRLGEPKFIPEGIAFDSTGDRFFIGSIAQRKVIVVGGKGEARDFSSSSDKLDPVLGLAVDPARKYLYAVTTNGFEKSAERERRNSVVRYDLKTGRLTNRFPAPGAMQLNDLAIAPDGTLYVTDSMSGTLFRRKPGEDSLAPFGAKGALRGANGIALGANGKLYVATSTGIARVDRTTGEPTSVPQPDTVMTGGMDGLYWHEGDLIGVQNTTNPGRVVRIALTEEGQRIDQLSVLQSSDHPDFDEPTTGAIAHGALHAIGNSYVGHYQPDGTISDAADLKGTAIVAVPLRR